MARDARGGLSAGRSTLFVAINPNSLDPHDTSFSSIPITMNDGFLFRTMQHYADCGYQCLGANLNAGNGPTHVVTNATRNGRRGIISVARYTSFRHGDIDNRITRPLGSGGRRGMLA
jgi:hypothetical protein